MKNHQAGIAACICALCIAAVSGQAPESQQLIAELDLSAKQKAAMDSLHQKRIDARHEHEKRMQKLKQAMDEELAKESPDGAQLMKYATQNADVIEEATKQRIEHLLAVKQILSKHQFEKFLKIQWPEQKEGRRRGRK